MKIFFNILILFVPLLGARAQTHQHVSLKGGLTALGNPVSGASIHSLQAKNTSVSNEKGEFIIAITQSDTLVISHVNFITQIIAVFSNNTFIEVVLQPTGQVLEEVTVVNTGYENIPKERATGSFSTLSNKQMSEQVSSSVLSRIEGRIPGVLFQRTGKTLEKITLRGDASILGSSPLIVVDNFPYAGDIDNINPNNIENITFLKDAAAASIWGARAGNGVIVITTKSGRFNQKQTVALHSNITLTDKPDLFYEPRMSIWNYVDWEAYLFEKGRFASIENSYLFPALSPAVELLIARRDGLMDETDFNNSIEQLKSSQDNRQDLLDYFYHRALAQRHAISIAGGNSVSNYYFSAGYDKNQSPIRANDDDRISLNFKNTYSIFKNLSFSGEVLLTQSTNNTNTNPPRIVNPYETLADANGNALPVSVDYRNTYKALGETNGLLNWQWKPVEEIGKAANRRQTTDYVMNVGLKYNFGKYLQATLKYQLEKQVSNSANRQDTSLYSTRSLINLYTQTTSTGLASSRPIPAESILDQSNQSLLAQSGRLQVNYQQSFHQQHTVHAIAGAEIRDLHTEANNTRLYGYKEKGLITAPVDYLTYYKLYNMTAWQRILYPSGLQDATDRHVSYFGNVSYHFQDRLSITASARKDAANLFGIKTNQRWQPLWSAGAAWNIHAEQFYAIPWLSQLRVRATYGVNGITATGVAYTTASYQRDNLTGLTYALIGNPPNPGARWEQVKITNLAVEFSSIQNKLSGSMEYYWKKGTDLVGNAPLDPTTGFFMGENYSVRRNYASTKGKGFDITLSSININRQIKWKSSLLLSNNNIKVAEYYGVPTIFGHLNGVPVMNHSMGELFTYQWEGLNNEGHPQGNLDHQPSNDYDAIIAETTPEDLKAKGSIIPQVFGAIHNEWTWSNFSIAMNISYKLNYVFRRSSFTYSIGSTHKDYENRWQQPGDEHRTNIPAIPVNLNNAGNEINFYSSSEALIEKGDHIRLQYINLGYQLPLRLASRLSMTHCRVYCNIANLGMLWRANKKGIDPDYQQGIPAPRNYSFGLQVSF